MIQHGWVVHYDLYPTLLDNFKGLEMVSTITFSQFTNAGDLQNDSTTVGLASGDNVYFNNPWTFLAPGPTSSRPDPVPSEAYYRLRLNTTTNAYEYYNDFTSAWTTINNTDDIAYILDLYASNAPTQGASLIGLQNQGEVSDATVQDLANAAIVVNTDNQSLVNAQVLASLATGLVTVTTGTGILGSITPVTVPLGGTGVNALTPYALLAGGTTSSSGVQSIASVGSSGQILTSNGASALPTFQTFSPPGFNLVINIQKFTTSGTYTPTAGMQYCIIECLGAGGGGGGAPSAPANNVGISGGGGAGGYSRIAVSAATIGGSQSVTVGTGGAGGTAGNNNGNAGGSTAVGIICTANGGSGGGAGAGGNNFAGQGGTAGTGTLNATGACGSAGYSAAITTVSPWGGGGANSIWGTGGRPVPSTSTNGNNALSGGYGAGGSGAASVNSGGAFTGGTGTNGIVIITEYI